MWLFKNKPWLASLLERLLPFSADQVAVRVELWFWSLLRAINSSLLVSLLGFLLESKLDDMFTHFDQTRFFQGILLLNCFLRQIKLEAC